MPPKSKLSIFEIQRILQERIRSCALCGGENWELEPDISLLRLGNLYMPREGRKIRCVLLTCHDCGNTHLINVERLIHASTAARDEDASVSARSQGDDEQSEYLAAEGD